MNERQNELWRKLEEYSLDAEGAPFPFSAKLARENGWTADFAARAIEEYKKYLFIAVAGRHRVSPSEVVDQVWHLHLIYSEDYWRRLCPEVLGMPFHHRPATGREDAEVYEDWYARTLESYVRFFGPPPGDIWPSPADRAASKEQFRRVDLDRHWVIRKPKLKVPVAGLALAAVITAGCAGNPYDLRGPEFLGLFVVLGGSAFAAAAAMRWSQRPPFSGPPVNDLDAYELAYLNGGGVLAANLAVTSLVQKDALKVGTDGYVRSTGSRPGDLHPLERAVFLTATSSRRMSEIRPLVATPLSEIEAHLRGRGLLVDGSQLGPVAWVPAAIGLAVTLFGFGKILVGLDREKPVVFLVMLVIASLIGTLALIFARRHRSRYGDSVLRGYQVHTPARATSGPDLMMTVAAFGMAGLAGTPLESLRKQLTPTSGSSSCGGGGGGDGGGCGGGGCGGCGGGD